MSDRSIDVNLTNKSDQDLIAEVKRRQELKAKLVTVLDRGLVIDRLHVPLPADVYGEWFPNDKVEIYRAQSMGFEIDTKYAKNRALHDDGTGDKAIVGDAIFMTCPREVKEIIEEIKREQYIAANSPKGGKQKEERDFASQANSVGLPAKLDSRIDSTNVDHIRAALTSKD